MDQQVDILERVAADVAGYTGPLRQLSNEAGVKYSWLVMFARGEIKNPGVIQITALARHFNRAAASH